MLSLTIREILTHLKDGRISAKDLCEKCLERSHQAKELNFLISETRELAQMSAADSDNRLDKKLPPRNLEGVPMVFKDNYCMKGIPTTCASRMLSNFSPPYNATMVQRTTAAGAVIVGKANMDEFAMGSANVDSVAGPVINPWKYKFRKRHGNERHHRRNNQSKDSAGDHVTSSSSSDWFIAGGSSGGSAVAVAVGACYAAFSSDTGGSTRNPASYCGVVGLKPTYGLTSRHGLIPLVNSMDVPGIVTRTVDDAATVLNVVAGHDVHDSTTVRDHFDPVSLSTEFSVKGLHVGIPKEYFAPGTSPDVVLAWRRAADMLERAGARVTEVSLPHTQYSIICYNVLCCCEVASNMARYDGIEYGLRAPVDDSTEELYAQSRREGFNYVVRSRILSGNWFLLKRNYEDYFIKAQRVRRLISDDFQKVFASGVDVLLTPTTLGDAPLFRDYVSEDNRTRTEQHDVYTQSANMAGIPAVSVPACLSTQGLPIGLQFIGNHFQEQKLLSVAQWFEQQVNFPSLNLDHLDAESPTVALEQGL
ncbi:glutamyl-tRNA(Gln) amidotransferase subunit A, mitochondrial-like [Haliotis rufescens]|uniref:glutamyl-tRNA(Gln) amidotransferase subunit A, mitochondrial-like n=1 Tax=Haliotis rufescens TaxID=6454 RepID=UPI00201EFCCA|nr:glutamyl-tRNA(Gln) amidotransferase subunit A, mitochondrial-like [Haliotis rufescens]